MDARGLNFALGETPFDDIKEIILSDNGYSCGSGDSFVTSKIEMHVDVVDMEAYAIAKICKKENIKFRCFKFISDEANKKAKSDWIKNCKKGAFLFSEHAKNLSLI
jgi:adenosylhomocysteine nucleosidase